MTRRNFDLSDVDPERVRVIVGRVFAVLLYLLSAFIWISLFRSDFCTVDANEILCTSFLNSPELPNVLEITIFVVGVFFLPISLYVAGIVLTVWLFGEFVFGYPNDPVKFTVHNSDRKIVVVFGTIFNLLVAVISWVYYVVRSVAILVLLLAWPITLVFGVVFSALWYGILSPFDMLAEKLDIIGL